MAKVFTDLRGDHYQIGYILEDGTKKLVRIVPTQGLTPTRLAEQIRQIEEGAGDWDKKKRAQSYAYGQAHRNYNWNKDFKARADAETSDPERKKRLERTAKLAGKAVVKWNKRAMSEEEQIEEGPTGNAYGSVKSERKQLRKWQVSQKLKKDMNLKLDDNKPAQPKDPKNPNKVFEEKQVDETSIAKRAGAAAKIISKGEHKEGDGRNAFVNPPAHKSGLKRARQLGGFIKGKVQESTFDKYPFLTQLLDEGKKGFFQKRKPGENREDKNARFGKVGGRTVKQHYDDDPDKEAEKNAGLREGRIGSGSNWPKSNPPSPKKYYENDPDEEAAKAAGTYRKPKKVNEAYMDHDKFVYKDGKFFHNVHGGQQWKHGEGGDHVHYDSDELQRALQRHLDKSGQYATRKEAETHALHTSGITDHKKIVDALYSHEHEDERPEHKIAGVFAAKIKRKLQAHDQIMAAKEKAPR